MKEPNLASQTNRREVLKVSAMGALGGVAAVAALAPGKARAADGAPQISYASWIQGYAMQVENPERLDQDTRLGWSAFVMGKPGTENWFHFAIPTPVIINDVRLQTDSVLLRFATGSADAWVRDVHVYDGWTRIATFTDVNLFGQQYSVRLTVPDTPPMNYGLGISVGVSFGVEALDHGMQFYGVGCDFVIRPSA
jgi:hypothetical protein